jgi:riboflavin transport system substrate-binding protein
MRRVFPIISVLILAAMSAFPAPARSPKVCVFVPGVVSGSPIYEQLVAGAKRAVAEVKGATLKVVEGGYNQADWLGQLSSLAEMGEFSLIASSNPAIPDLCAQAAASFPSARFFVADSWLPGNASIHTVLYNQLEQGYMVGYMAGLASSGKLPGAGKRSNAGDRATHMAGLIIAQHYPSLDKLIAPGFEKGLKAADPAAVLETRVLGNWYDATKASELASGLFDAGAAAILPIAGGAGQGVVSAASSKGRYVLWFDDDSGYRLAPGTVIGCAVLRQERLVYERVKALLEQGSESPLYGTAEVVGVKGGYVDFAADDPSYRGLPAAVRADMAEQVAKLKSGAIVLPVSGL